MHEVIFVYVGEMHYLCSVPVEVDETDITCPQVLPSSDASIIGLGSFFVAFLTNKPLKGVSIQAYRHCH